MTEAEEFEFRLRLEKERGVSKPEATPAEPSMLDQIKQGAGNLAAGAVRGAGSIGATIMAPLDAGARALGVDPNGMLGSVVGRTDRRSGMDGGLQAMGAETDSLTYQGGKLGAEIAGTMGAGGLLARGAATVAPAAAAKVPAFMAALKSGGMSAPGAGLATRAAGGAVAGGASAGIVNPDDAGLGAGVGAALPGALKVGGAIGSATGRALRGAPVSPEVQALAQRAGQLGIDVPADRLAQSKPLNAVAAGLNYVPFSGRAATEGRMQSQLNRALSRTFGQDSDNVTMALRKAGADLGGEFDRVLKSNSVNVDQQFLGDLADAANKASRELGSDGASIIGKQVDDIIEKAQTGSIDAQAAYNIKRTLDRISNRPTPEAFYARELKKSLMGALDRSLGPQEASAFAATRKQYGNMLELEALAQNGAEGNVSIARVANMKNLSNPDLKELADIAAQFLKPRESQHGAAQRAFAGLGVGSVAGLPALAGSVVAGRAANSALNSRAARSMLLGQPTGLLNPNALETAARVAPLLGGDR